MKEDKKVTTQAWFQEVYKTKVESGKRAWIKERAEQNRSAAAAK
jgi:hypothetical protein